MADIRPFRGLRYSSQFAPQLASLLSPPYDVVSPTVLERCRRHSPYNIVHLEVASAEAGIDPYRAAGQRLRQWLRQGVLVREGEPLFYLHHHRFWHQGEERRRRGLVAAVGLGEGVVRPHEGTLSQPKQDRLRLLRATRTQISPVFALYDDPGGEIAALLAPVETSPPLLEASLPAEGESHRLWAIPRSELATRLSRLFQRLPLFIADGHHRFETALAYRRRLRRAAPGQPAYHFVMMSLTSTADPGLVILPVHRLVRGLPQERLHGLRGRLDSYFEVEEFPLDQTPRDGLITSGLKGAMIGVVGLKPGSLLRLSLRPEAPLPPRLPGGRQLNVMVLHHLVLTECLGGVGEIAYTPDSAEVMQRLGEYQLGFLVSPMPVAVVTEVASAGERLPGKSTYFHPKLPTGLVLFPVEGEL